MESERAKLRKVKSRFPTSGKALLLVVHDGDPEQEYTVARGHRWEKFYYNEVFLGAQEWFGAEYGHWRGNWAITKERQT